MILSTQLLPSLVRRSTFPSYRYLCKAAAPYANPTWSTLLSSCASASCSSITRMSSKRTRMTRGSFAAIDRDGSSWYMQTRWSFDSGYVSASSAFDLGYRAPYALTRAYGVTVQQVLEYSASEELAELADMHASPACFGIGSQVARLPKRLHSGPLHLLWSVWEASDSVATHCEDFPVQGRATGAAHTYRFRIDASLFFISRRSKE